MLRNQNAMLCIYMKNRSASKAWHVGSNQSTGQHIPGDNLSNFLHPDTRILVLCMMVRHDSF